jgi:hypothetical protein
VAAAAFEALLRSWLGRAAAGVLLKERATNLETGTVSRDDMTVAGSGMSLMALVDGMWYRLDSQSRATRGGSVKNGWTMIELYTVR